MPQTIGVLLPLPFNDVFDYKADDNICVGDLVRVSFGREKHIGVVWKLGKTCNLPDTKIKAILEKTNFPPLTKELIKFVEFVSKYNLTLKGQVLKMVLSVRTQNDQEQTTTLYKLSGKTLTEAKLKNSDARWRVINLLRGNPEGHSSVNNNASLSFTRAEIMKGTCVTNSVIKTMIDAGVLEPITIIKKKKFQAPNSNHSKVKLTAEQQLAAINLTQKINNGFSVTLLDGVTGSGKTEVYFEAVAEALKDNGQVLIMVPEIALTSQWLSRFERRFGVTPAVWHSGLTSRERFDNYQAIEEGRAKVIIGARSGLFLPYPGLKLIVIDESHDHSYKQEELGRYQGRDMAVVRAKFENFPVILSTATPSMETIVNVEEGKYDIVKLTSRYATATLPEIKIIDLKKDKPKKYLIPCGRGQELPGSQPAAVLGEGSQSGASNKEYSINKQSHRSYTPYIKEFVRELRQNNTPQENKLWHKINNNQLGVKFRRQHQIDNKYIADFVCLEKRLIIELDGGQHCDSNTDPQRTYYLEQQKFRVIRFWNNEIDNNPDGCIQEIQNELNSSNPNLAPCGRGQELPSLQPAAVLDEESLSIATTKQKSKTSSPSYLAPTLVKAIEENLAKGEQTMLFLNRRGYAPLTICHDCGYRIQCPHCTAWMTEHRKAHKLVCHQCGHTTSIPARCPDCQSEEGLTACGPGVERIAEEVKLRFPSARTAIVSSDLTSSLKDVSNIITQMEKGEVDILIGTQILAKGHHFPTLTLVGIIDADLGLMGSDLRATEQTFQLLSQVSGRAGRGDKKGTVYVQTMYPDNAVLKALINNDREQFLKLEKKTRQMLKMPPFGKLAAIIITGNNQDATEKVATALSKTAPNTDHIQTLGPAPAPIFMLRGKYRYRLLLKTHKSIKIQDILKKWLSMIICPTNVRIEIDIDPYSFM